MHLEVTFLHSHSVFKMMLFLFSSVFGLWLSSTFVVVQIWEVVVERKRKGCFHVNQVVNYYLLIRASSSTFGRSSVEANDRPSGFSVLG